MTKTKGSVNVKLMRHWPYTALFADKLSIARKLKTTSSMMARNSNSPGCAHLIKQIQRPAPACDPVTDISNRSLMALTAPAGIKESAFTGTEYADVIW